MAGVELPILFALCSAVERRAAERGPVSNGRQDQPGWIGTASSIALHVGMFSTAPQFTAQAPQFRPLPLRERMIPYRTASNVVWGSPRSPTGSTRIPEAGAGADLRRGLITRAASCLVAYRRAATVTRTTCAVWSTGSHSSRRTAGHQDQPRRLPSCGCDASAWPQPRQQPRQRAQPPARRPAPARPPRQAWFHGSRTLENGDEIRPRVDTARPFALAH